MEATLSIDTNSITIKDKITGWHIAALIMVILLMIIKTATMFFSDAKLTWSDFVYPISSIAFTLMLINFFIARASLTIQGGEFTVVKKTIFGTRTDVYQIAEMEQIELEFIKVKKPFYTTVSKDKVLTFFYHDKEIALGFGRDYVNAGWLLQKLTA